MRYVWSMRAQKEGKKVRHKEYGSYRADPTPTGKRAALEELMSQKVPARMKEEGLVQVE